MVLVFIDHIKKKTTTCTKVIVYLEYRKQKDDNTVQNKASLKLETLNLTSSYELPRTDKNNFINAKVLGVQ